MELELQVLKLVAERLDFLGIPYMVSGSVALNFWGQPRMTRDIDLVVELGPTDSVRLVQLFAEEFYCDAEVIRAEIEREGMFNLIHNELVVKVDFIVRRKTPYQDSAFARRRRIIVEGTRVWVIAPEDLVLSKLAWAKDSHSEFQLKDVRTLLTSGPPLDREYIEHWATELGVEDLFAEVR